MNTADDELAEKELWFRKENATDWAREDSMRGSSLLDQLLEQQVRAREGKDRTNLGGTNLGEFGRFILDPQTGSFRRR